MAKIKSGVSGAYEPDQFLTVRDASRLLGVHASTVRRWCRAGLLKEYRIGLGHHRRFRHSDLIALMVK